MKKLKITVDGKAYEVTVEILDEGRSHSQASLPPSAAPTAVPPPAAPQATPQALTAGDLPSPIAGKVVSVDVQPGQQVEPGTTLVTIESMKMNTFVSAPSAGKVEAIAVKVGDSVQEGQPLLTLS